MSENAIVDDQLIVETALRRMCAKVPGIPSEKVRIFLAKIGEEYERSGGVGQDFMDDLLQKLKDGAL
jgi:hypothetical protein